MVYTDLNIQHGGRVCVAELQRLGYAVVAVNVEFAGDSKLKPASAMQPLPLTASDSSNKSSKAVKRAKLFTPAAPNALQLQSNGKPAERQVQQLTRITIKVEDMNSAMAINSSAVVKTYDIVAAEATTAKVFQYLCELADVDIITFDVTNRLPFVLKRPWIDAAIQRGIYFEVPYTPCLGDAAGRRYFFSNASNLVRVTGGRHVLLTSAATRDLLLRAPFDVVNIGILVGLTYGQALDAIVTAATNVLKHAAARRGRSDVVLEVTAGDDVTMATTSSTPSKSIC